VTATAEQLDTPVPSPSATSSPIPPLAREALKNAAYPNDWPTGGVAQLVDGVYREEYLPDSATVMVIRLSYLAVHGDLNGDGVEWGLTVNKVEIRLIDPPADIKKAMHKQKTAEQERRSMRLLATGDFEAAEQQKLAIIQRAEGEREAAIHVAEGQAEAIRLVNEAAKKYFVGNAQTLKRLEMVENALRDNAKIVITEHGISPTLLLGSLPVNVSSKK
jgi:regulator of protease activity HflC (stomatin/prohibitin superfamily)